MNRKAFEEDLRRVDEAVIKSGEYMQNGYAKSIPWCIIYTLAVAVWHLLQEQLRRADNG